MSIPQPQPVLSRSSGRRTLSPGLAAAMASALSCGLALLFALLADSTSRDVSGNVVIVVASVVSLAVICLARGRATIFLLRPAACALLAWFPYLFMGSANALGEPIVWGAHTRCGNGIMGLYFLGLCSIPIVFSAAVGAAALLQRVGTRVPMLMVALAVTGVSIGALGASMRRVRNPDPDGYLASLPVLATLTGEGARFAGPGFSIAAGAGGCVVEPRAATRALAWSLSTTCEGLRILEGPRGLWFVQTADGPVAFRVQGPGPSGEPGIVTREDVFVTDVGAYLRAPVAWMELSAWGCGGALLALAFAVGARRRVTVWRAARAGVHGGDGWVSFADGAPPVHVPAAARLPGGDVLVVEHARAEAHYREHGRLLGGVRVMPGTLQDVERACDARAMGLAALAILLATLTLAPLLAAATHGLLG